MAKLKGVSGEGLSGLVGNLVFYSYKGVPCVRTRPLNRSKNSWSEKQLLARKRFTALKAFWKRFTHTPVKGIWNSAEKGKRGDNLFVKVNMPAFGYDGTLIDQEQIHFSAGQLPLPFGLTAARSQVDPNKAEVSWQDEPGNKRAWSDDKLMMMASYDGNFTGPLDTGAVRKQESALIDLPPVSGTIDSIWLFFASEDRKLYSPDQYFRL